MNSELNFEPHNHTTLLYGHFTEPWPWIYCQNHFPLKDAIAIVDCGRREIFPHKWTDEVRSYVLLGLEPLWVYLSIVVELGQWHGKFWAIRSVGRVVDQVYPNFCFQKQG